MDAKPSFLEILLKKVCAVIFFCSSLASKSQTLAVNPVTNLISIRDSIEIKDKSPQEVKNVISKWGNTLMDLQNLKTVYKLDNAKQTETISISLPVETVLTEDKGNNKFQTNGTLTYNKIKTSGLNAFAPIVTFGMVKFSFIYSITTQKVTYEFTNLEYSHDMTHYARFETVKPPQDRYNGSLIFKMSKNEWNSLKEEYYNRLIILSTNFKNYSSNLLQSNLTSSNESAINYESYQSIKTNMTYHEVKKILGGEGKELSNANAQVNGKSVTQQAIVWSSLDKAKTITVSFTVGKVVSKSQTNL